MIVRTDFNLLMRDGVILDDFRIKESIPTIRFILGQGGFPRIISHLGRPHGRFVPELSLKKVAWRLSHIIGKKVIFISNPFKMNVYQQYAGSHDILFFENIRFWPGEEKNNSRFGYTLARWGDIYINEAFANCHRKHASMVALAQALPSYAGFHLKEEIINLNRVIKTPQKPLVAVLGGAKLETKIPLIRRFLKDADRLLIGGALANMIFSRRSGIGKKKYFLNHKLYLPTQVVVIDKGNVRLISPHEVKRYKDIVDIGPEGINYFKSLVKDAGTIVWNGPLGKSDVPRFTKGTVGFSHMLQRIKAFKVVGGGDTVGVLRKYGALKGYNHVSTGGGAMLEYLAEKKLPALEALERKA